MTEQLRTSTRDLEELRKRATVWLRSRVGADATVSEMSRPSENGLSSETLFFTATWDGQGTRCVARLAPAVEAVPVFPSYDLRAQFHIMRLAREKAGIPAPRALWFEPDPEPLGTPFFVMERAEGEVPPDVMPYTFGGWLHDASPEDQRRLQDESVRLLAALHQTAFTPEELAPFGAAGLRAHVEAQRAYYAWAHGECRVPLLERAFGWLEEHWPDDPGPDVLTWGDARIGNVMYQDFTPVAVLDWEMAAVGPRELDLSWMIFLHRFFQDITVGAGLPGMPGFMRREDVCRTYRELTGYEPRDLAFYEMYAALRHGVIMARIWHRRIHFGELTMPDDPDDLVLHRATIEELLGGYEAAS
ncbi:Phosphotransferase [[Actinomadura] parvosata subsp. kistnae]|uniref:Phosphotransferase family protein n=1 Tax=[Actinomadura] parvosata subsp. kistnae TaxID=1909395 RepID=A0A1V0A456_9ACTN|nr:phosphotransferase family protein [Nonomuraea sp. ATCC 55076]AQZ64932.1 phosphotransferase family protein [Nonomuraea sp. ATCC 55076]SPL96161.1 Phosphotransferase [Actinomadura parvosata subsp. kistnae]